jgi:nucleotide-binding universal stress UspA family protein
MKQDREYLSTLSAQLESEGYEVKTVLAMGDPATEIIKLAQDQPIDLIAMTTHGHRLLGDFLHGSTADKVRHQVDVPVLLLKVRK